ncbi:X-ray radiation resistance-associated protein 1 isoform X2 [Rhinatrema bivittatum]|uniref:X-ray radiation resistance-associated protein 1 isoform X2 n=1 Tax=Rhinatrema bivittatum TaxID=194408 RepID=UPI00112D01AF|nr:X-ray radiation resistance-associated protein 1 isoform X2 [Rhinatrema bivittatum]
MATTWLFSLEDQTPNNPFPVRSNFRKSNEGAGHWKVAYRTTRQRRLSAIDCSNSRYQLSVSNSSVDKTQHPTSIDYLFREPKIKEKILDVFYLLSRHRVMKPIDLYFVDVSYSNITSAVEEDFKMFASVASINAAENQLTLEAFRTFPALRELDLSMNGIRNIKVGRGDFPHLEVLDLSYNYVSPEDVLALSILPRLKGLYLTGNELISLPMEMAFSEMKKRNSTMFPSLEILKLDDNKLSNPNVFVSLANLSSLKQLNLDRNGISEIPYLQPVQRFPLHSTEELWYASNFSDEKEAKKQEKCVSDPNGLKFSQEDRLEYMMLPNKKASHKKEVNLPEKQVQDASFTTLPHADKDDSFLVDFISGSRIFLKKLNPLLEPPLPQLTTLSLADNKITTEKNLIAVALFPLLSELVIHGNPLVTRRTGDPPLLTSFLQHRMGIKLVRRKSSEVEKLHISMPVKANRKVKTYIPKVPKQPLMLQPPHHWHQELLLDKSRLLGLGKESQLSANLLLPIKSSSKEQSEEPYETMQVPGRCQEIYTEETQDVSAEDENVQSVFMTQVSDLPDVEPAAQRKKHKRLKKQLEEVVIPEKYQGYEELLSVRVDPDFMEPVGILGNVKALEYALKHLRVYRDSKAKLNNIQKPFIPMEKKHGRVPSAPPWKSKAEVLEEILTNMKNTQHITEIPLAPLLQKSSSPKKEHGEALALLKEAQAEYGKVLAFARSRAKELQGHGLDSPAVPKDVNRTQHGHPAEAT